MDALWLRDPSTINDTLLSCHQEANIAASLGFKSKLFEPMGPFPLEDLFDMGAAQYSAVHTFWSSFSNVYHASVQGLQAMVVAKDTRKMTVTKCPTYGEFFERIIQGLHKRMG